MKKRTGHHPREFCYVGDLSQHPLPELLFTIGQYNVPGVITFTQKHLTKQIFIRDKTIIFAASNSPDDHLGEFLFRCGKISRQNLDKSIQLISGKTAERQGEVLIELKALQRGELEWAVRSHQQAIVWSLFNWFEGQVKFHIGNFKQGESIILDLKIPRAILDGVRNIREAKRVIGFLGNRGTVLEPEENSLLSIEAMAGDERERDILKRVDGKISLYELCASTPYGAHETAKILYGLYMLKLIRKRSEGIHVVSTLPTASFQ